MRKASKCLVNLPRSICGQVNHFVRIVVLCGIVTFLAPVFQPELSGQNAGVNEAVYVRRSRLRSRLRGALTVFGDRLEKAGKERTTLTGIVKPAPPGAAVTFQAIWELPGNLRIETPNGVLSFDGQTLTGAATPLEEALVETLYYDTADHFFLSQSQGFTTRFLGDRFQLDDLRNKNYAGPYYDIYQVIDPMYLGAKVLVQPKLYYLNSDTLLLERVRYRSNRYSTPKDVEIRLENWQRGEGQAVPCRTVRWENGQVLFTLTVTSALIEPRQK